MSSQDQCHPALLTLDIVLGILQSLHEAGKLRALASAAVTCMAWKDPALDLLWKHIELTHILPVLAPVELLDSRFCYPGLRHPWGNLDDEITEMQSPEEWENQPDRLYAFTRPIADPDWTRFLVYAKRVRTVRADYVDLSDTLIRPEIRRLHLSTGSIFPMATTVHWSDPLTWPQVAHFITPTLRNLAIKLGYMVTNQIHFTSLMTLIPKVAENLTELDVAAYRIDYDSFVTLTGMIRQLPKLQVLSVRLPDIEASDFLTTIAAIPSLQRLQLRCSFGLPDWWSGVVTSHPFSQLEEISVEMPHVLHEVDGYYLRLWEVHWRGLAQIFEALSPNGMLRQITLRQCRGGPSTGIHSLTRAIALHSQLQAFRICLIRYADLIDFLPLKACTSLTTLEIVMHSTLAITVTDLADIVQDMASLQRVTVAFSRAENAPTLPLSAVGVVASLCPSIEYIELTVNATQPNVPPSAASITPNASLKVVELGEVKGCPIDDAHEVARYLQKLSANPDFRVDHRHNSYACEGDREIYATRWSKVMRSVNGGLTCIACEAMEPFVME